MFNDQPTSQNATRGAAPKHCMKQFVKQACYEGKRPLGRLRSGWEDNTELKWIIERYDGVVWTD
jgi:hypothetical protein